MDEMDRSELNDALSYFERAIQIVSGLLITIIAGFLSQVWSSASIEYRSELANTLVGNGSFFFGMFSLMIIRRALAIGANIKRRLAKSKSDISSLDRLNNNAVNGTRLWAGILLLQFILLSYNADSTAKIIVKYASASEKITVEPKSDLSSISWPKLWQRCTDNLTCP